MAPHAHIPVKLEISVRRNGEDVPASVALYGDGIHLWLRGQPEIIMPYDIDLLARCAEEYHARVETMRRALKGGRT